ncbi:MAG: SHOCT domain-containing protein [Chloroflexi bacterium]|nr:SHOCT domain-containing protein [Chloroflexota bacterium]
MKTTGALLTVVLVALLVLLLLGGAGMMGFGGFGMMGPGFAGGYGMTLAPHASAGAGGYGGQYGIAYNPVGGVLSLIFWALIIGGFVLLVVWLARNNAHATASANSALEILKGRYAKGEISKDQFDAMKRDIE